MSDDPLAAPDPRPAQSNSPIRDVADFHMRWAEFRPLAHSLCANRALSAAEQDLMVWMVALLDRIGPQDIETGGVWRPGPQNHS